MRSEVAVRHGKEHGRRAAKTLLATGPEFKSRPEARTAIRQIEKSSRQFSPADPVAEEIEDFQSWKSEMLWAMFDEGVEEGVREALDEWAEEDHDCRKYAAVDDEVGENVIRCGRCGDFLQASVGGES